MTTPVGDDVEGDPAPPRWFDELRSAAAAVRELLAAQWDLLGAELRLARAAAMTALLAALAATVFAVALGLTVLALLGWALAHWFGSWAWALFALAVLQALGVIGAIVLFRKCLHWLSLPVSRAQWRALVRESKPGEPVAEGELRADDDMASTH
ncbi:MAG TPA: ABC transporter ATP-binding protein [Rhodanobacteraceae bacterium]|nr:ABC transporter ATP-binding protein [Rhodanobacteraceae bacterium]